MQQGSISLHQILVRIPQSLYRHIQLGLQVGGGLEANVTYYPVNSFVIEWLAVANSYEYFVSGFLIFQRRPQGSPHAGREAGEVGAGVPCVHGLKPDLK